MLGLGLELGLGLGTVVADSAGADSDGRVVGMVPGTVDDGACVIDVAPGGEVSAGRVATGGVEVVITVGVAGVIAVADAPGVAVSPRVTGPVSGQSRWIPGPALAPANPEESGVTDDESAGVLGQSTLSAVLASPATNCATVVGGGAPADEFG